jgi:hypothetical protein
MDAVMGVNEHVPADSAPGSEAGTGVRHARPSLLSLLVEAGIASEEQLRLAMAEGMGLGERLGEVVLRKGWIDQVALGRLLATQWRLPFLEDGAVELADVGGGDAAARVRELGGCLVAMDAGVPQVVVVEPATERLDELRAFLGGEVVFSVVSAATLARLTAEAETVKVEAVSAGEAAAAVVEAAAVAAARTEQLIDELDAATAALADLRERVGRLRSARDAAEAALADSRQHVAALEQQISNQKVRQRELEQGETRSREQLATVTGTLAELLRALERG